MLALLLFVDIAAALRDSSHLDCVQWFQYFDLLVASTDYQTISRYCMPYYDKYMLNKQI